jgi:CBS domain-containing protein
MALRVRQVMTANPLALPAGTTLVEAARTMREHEVSDVLVYDYGSLRGVITDRDVTIRAIAEGFDPSSTSLAEVCSRPLLTVTPDDTIEMAADLMRQRGVRRLAVVDDGGAVGIVSLNDLVHFDLESALVEAHAGQSDP